MANKNKENIDHTEVNKFNALAHKWWDPSSEFKPLHEINPLRINFIKSKVNLEGKSVLDVGCGGGILAEALAQEGATVTGIDQGEKVIKIAELRVNGKKMELTSLPDSEWAKVVNDSKAFWDETSSISPRAKKVVDAFKLYAETMDKAGYPYR